ncbi:MAG: sugar phosphate isomerase/epimerase [Acetatifactor muris]|nr:sugar phosphate isomerase/epimerase [Acetatifactor muris]
MDSAGTIQFGMPTLIEADSPEDAMGLCRELGLAFVELNMNLPRYQAEGLENAAYLKSLQQKYQVGYTIHLDENLNVCDFNRAVAAAYMETAERAIRAARAIGAPVLNMHMNHGVYFTLPDRKVLLFERYFEQYMQSWKRFRAVCEEAADGAEILICIENTDGYTEYEKEAVTFLLESSVFGLTWDIGHSHGAGDTDEAFIMAHQDKLRHFHIHDGLGRKNHMTLGTGEIDLQQRLHIAEERGCRCVVETKTADALRKSVDWLAAGGYIASRRA